MNAKTTWMGVGGSVLGRGELEDAAIWEGNRRIEDKEDIEEEEKGDGK